MHIEWQDPKPADVSPSFIDDMGGHPLTATLLYQRGVQSMDAARPFMYFSHYTPRPASDLPDMDKAVARIRQALKANELIAIWGDFDVDGQTATALLVSALRDLGASVVSYIPQRQSEGHGVHVPSLARLIDGGATLVITCDTGVDAHEAVKYARSRGVDVIITDHHKLPDTFPDAVAVVNSRRVSVDHPLRHLPGVGVAYKLIEALAPATYDTEPLLDLVALGIVADVAIQQGDTRYLLQRGLGVLSNTKRLGLLEIMRLAKIDPNHLSETDIAFGIAPRMNALGRLSDANVSTELLTTDALKRARELAERLDALNSERKRLTEEVWQGVQQILEHQPHLLKYSALVLSHPAWHTGVVGIVANQCVERYGKPTLLLSSPPGEPTRGSARSIDGVDITDAIAENADLLIGYGGHTMAAGVTLDTENITAFRQALSDSVLTQRKDNPQDPTLQIDAWLPLGDLSLELVTDLKRLAPFGAGNPRPVIGVRDVLVVGKEMLGRSGKHFKLIVENRAGKQRPIYWWKAETPPTGRFDLALTLHENIFRGERNLQPEWIAARALPDEPVTVRARRPQAFTDYRGKLNRADKLQQVIADEGESLIVWGEATRVEGVTLAHRLDLTEHAALAMWSVPSSSAVWDAILRTVMPERVYLLAGDVTADQPEVFLKRLAGLVRYAINQKDGRVDAATLAAMTNQREATVRAGVDWLVAAGHVSVVEDDGGAWVFTANGEPDAERQRAAMSRVTALLKETAAYRAHWQRTDITHL